MKDAEIFRYAFQKKKFLFIIFINALREEEIADQHFENKIAF